MAAGIYCLGLVQTIDPDLWWHLKTGERILGHGVPKVDPFSYSMSGNLWVAHEWLSEVILFLIFKAGGLPALMISFAVFGVIIFGFVYRTCSGRPYMAAVLTFLAFAASRYLWGARPQVFNIAMLAVFLWLIQSIRLKLLDRKWLYALIPLTTLWTNLHSGYLMGIVVMLTVWLGDLIQVFVLRFEEGALDKRALLHFTAVIPVSVLAAIVNPAGRAILGYPFETLTSKVMQANILEWQTPTFHHWNYWPFLVIMILGVFAFMIAPPRKNVSNFLLYAGAMATGLFARRHIPFFAIVSIPVVSGALTAAFAPAPGMSVFSLDRFKVFRFVINPVLALLIAAGVLCWTDLRLKKNAAVISRNYPVQAVSFIRDRGLMGKRVFNEYVWGGFLIWNDIPVFIDGRADLYGDKFFRNYLATRDVRKNLREVEAVFDRFRVDYLLLRPDSALAAICRVHRKWQEVYRDKVSCVCVRRVPTTPPDARLKQ
jgi:hypothetical protein